MCGVRVYVLHMVAYLAKDRLVSILDVHSGFESDLLGRIYPDRCHIKLYPRNLLHSLRRCSFIYWHKSDRFNFVMLVDNRSQSARVLGKASFGHTGDGIHEIHTGPIMLIDNLEIQCESPTTSPHMPEK